MMPASKHGDPQIGVDIHLCIVPPSPSPVPLPTPHTSVVFDPFDYVPILGATITVCGMKRATAGTNATAIHIPPGFPFAPKLPDKDDEIFMGSSTVVADGDPFSFTSVPTLSCQVAGMISPPRLKKKGSPKAMLLPTTINLAIPTNVLVGGPPTISLLGMAFKAGFAALGRFARSGLFKRIRQRLFKNLDPGFLKCIILRAEPVNILTGEVSIEHEDFNLPGRIPIEWHRTYSSGTRRKGLCGYGWETPADIRLEIDSSSGNVTMVQPTGGPLFFDHLPAAEGDDAAMLELMDGALLIEYGDEFQVRTKEDRIYHFPKTLSQVSAEGGTEFPIGRISDLCGNWLDFERHAGRLSGIRESVGRYLDITMDNGRIQKISLRLPGREKQHVFVKYQYDEKEDLVTVLDPFDHPYTFGYENHYMVRHTDRNGLSFYYEYETSSDEIWRVIHAWGDGDLYNYRFEYFDDLNERRITDSLGNTFIVKLNQAGLPISEIDPQGGMTIFEYDDTGRTTAVVDQDLHRTEYEYDDRGNLLKLIRADGSIVETKFNTLNKATEVIDPAGSKWRQEWDERGLLIKQTTPLGYISTFEYDIRGQITAYTNPRGARTEFSFDTYGNLSSLKNALNHRTQLAYDSLGNISQEIDPLGKQTLYFNDAKCRLVEVHLPSGAFVSCDYDAEDNLTRFIDENGHVTEFAYFGQGVLASHRLPDGHSIQYQYDTEERLVGITNQRGEIYQLKRDALGRIVEEIDYWGQVRTYDYSSCGYIKRSVDPMGRVINFETDSMGRVVKKSFPNPDGSEIPFEESFEYNANGNIISCSNPHIQIARKYDLQRRLVVEKHGEHFVICNNYDETGNRIARRTDIVNGKKDGHEINYAFDVLDQLTGITIDKKTVISFERNSTGQIIAGEFGPILHSRIEYSDDGYVTRQCVQNHEKSIIDVTYTYDNGGNLIERQDGEFGIDKYTYDPVGRITRHLNPLGALKEYINDPAGGLLQTRIFEKSPPKETEPTVKSEHIDWSREGQYEGTAYRFDRAGNLVERSDERGTLTLYWDPNHRLVKSRMNNQTTQYYYDPFGRRIAKQMDRNYIAYFWDDDMMIGEQSTEEIPETQNPHVKTREWVYFPNSYSPFAMIGSTEPDSVLYYHNDPNGCPTKLFDQNGKLMWAADHTIWGAIRHTYIKEVDNPIRMQGQYYDAELDLHYNRYRYYAPALGEFASQDPLSIFAGANLYEYATNALGWIDPLGLKKCNITKAAKKALGDAPAAMVNPHMHHIVMEGAFTHWSRANRKLVTQARTILRKHNINIQGIDNIVWAQNHGHSVDYARKVLTELQAADPLGRDAVVDTLADIGNQISKGTF